MRSSKEFSTAFPLVAKVPPPGPVTSVHFASLDALHKGGDSAITELLQKGAAILQYQQSVVGSHQSQAVTKRLKRFPEFACRVANATTLASEVGHALTSEPGVGFALLHRQRTGRGQLVDASLQHSGVWCNAWLIVSAASDPELGERWTRERGDYGFGPSANVCESVSALRVALTVSPSFFCRRDC